MDTVPPGEERGSRAGKLQSTWWAPWECAAAPLASPRNFAGMQILGPIPDKRKDPEPSFQQCTHMVFTAASGKQPLTHIRSRLCICCPTVAKQGHGTTCVECIWLTEYKFFENGLPHMRRVLGDLYHQVLKTCGSMCSPAKPGTASGWVRWAETIQTKDEITYLKTQAKEKLLYIWLVWKSTHFSWWKKKTLLTKAVFTIANYDFWLFLLNPKFFGMATCYIRNHSFLLLSFL